MQYQRLRNRRGAIYVLPIVMLWAAATVAWPQQGQQSEGACSPNFSQVDVGGNLVLNCGAGRNELQRLSRDLNKVLATSRAGADTTAEVARGLNSVLPLYAEQLRRMEGKQDKQDAAVAEILALVQRTLRTSPTGEVADKLASQRSKLLAGAELSECGCWGGSGARYGQPIVNPECLGGVETTVACRVKSGDNVCSRGIFGLVFNEAGYPPWQRMCK